jgi:hypothetical protein
MDPNSKQKQFETSITPLAAYLYISGIEKLGIDTSKQPAIFIFKHSKDGHIDKLIAEWENGIAVGNVKAFYKTYKSFLKEIKDGGNGLG